jgi:hypothetical protein
LKSRNGKQVSERHRLSHIRAKNESHLLSMPLRKVLVGRNEETMYTGTLIDDLMETVERSEKRTMLARSQEENLAYFYALAQSELSRIEPDLLGVA